ncbi:dTDP-4-dehydrorhamnose reductase [Alishewanella sp. WH16-1]|uniref:dTDP-4-dehydrorhamnose reductase n=1 Tax=Alishewanella sp. WH16-1 TaxID=1651088 RepID=UPI00070C5FB2|nr:dTDP-4-dehydrorhamnose reductase [Alishewanella sp. WH16-1]KRS21845.1 dTDP-4-dehydrorhamnose reductase [Alishewanella sp. WH16-1]
MVNSLVVLITGANGQLGQALQAEAAGFPALTLISTGRSEVDICDTASIGQAIQRFQPQVIINCSAYTAVDKAEAEPAQAYRINRDGVSNLAAQAALHNIALLHISTDYVFSGEQAHPYTEQDSPAPKSVYGASKLAGEQALLQSGCEGAIIRTSWLYSEFGTNFVKTMLRLAQSGKPLKVVADQYGSPTYARDLAIAILQMAEATEQPLFNPPQLWHYANNGITSWYDFAGAIFHTAGLECTVEPIQTSAYPTAARRPAFSALASGKIQQHFNTPVPSWRDSLKLALTQLLSQASHKAAD